MGHDRTLNNLHNQLHALEDAFCDVTEEQAKTPAYALAVTHKKELWVIFKRTWRDKSQQPERAQHVGLFMDERRELRATLQTLT